MHKPGPATGYVAIVDDDTSLRTALAKLLSAHGIAARTYASAREFLESLPSGIADCLVLDMNMPEMTGLELLRELSRLDISIPTIVVTAHDVQSFRAKCSALGAIAYLDKPVSGGNLIAAIRRAMG